jgi:lysozyme family protein
MKQGVTRYKFICQSSNVKVPMAREFNLIQSEDIMSDATEDEGRIFDLNQVPADELAREVGKDGDDLHIDPLEQIEPALEANITKWRVAKALEHLRGQLNAAFPQRSKASDGTIGDAAHASRSSDHNPWVVDEGIGVVTAFDVTHDPANGCDAGQIAEAIRGSRDSRIKYIIWNRRIANSKKLGVVEAWTWRAYTGASPHNHHCHISVQSEKALYDDRRDWVIRGHGELEANTDDEARQLDLIGAALGALPGDEERPVVERLIDAQDEIAALLSINALRSRAIRADDTDEAVRPTFEELRPEYEKLWATCVIRPERARLVAWYRNTLVRYKPQYEQVSAATGAPWWFIGVVHALEASFNFRGHLHNGDPLGARTVNVPANRPPRWNPPNDWLSSAIDAITFEGLAGQGDWSVARALYRLEGYNGYSYHVKGINSPYLWSFSTHYSKGKFVRDHVYDPNAVSAQCGAGVILKALQIGGEISL